MTPAAGAVALGNLVSQRVDDIKQKAVAALPRAANALRNAEIEVLTNASPSAPGSPPGVRSGSLRGQWSMEYGGSAENGYFGITSHTNYAGYLENGTRKMAARPFLDPIQQAALPKITAIFEEIGG